MNSAVNFFTSRGENLLCLPFKLVDIAIDLEKTVSGVAASALSIVTWGKSEQINGYSEKALASYRVLPKLYLSLLVVINPSAKYNIIKSNDLTYTGSLTRELSIPIFEKAYGLAIKNSFWEKRILSRVCFVFGAIVSTITRIIDLAFGIFGAALSLATRGEEEKINDFATRQLTSLGLVWDICYAARGFINPQQFIPARNSEAPDAPLFL